MGGLSGDADTYIIDTLVYDTTALQGVVSDLETALQTQRIELSTQAAMDYATFSDDVPLTSMVQTLEGKLALAATSMETATLSTAANGKANKADTYDLDQFDSLEESAETALESLEVAFDTYASKTFVNLITTGLANKALRSEVYDAQQLSDLFQALQDELDLKVVASEYPSAAEYAAARAKIVRWTAAVKLTSVNSGPCMDVLVGVTRRWKERLLCTTTAELLTTTVQQ